MELMGHRIFQAATDEVYKLKSHTRFFFSSSEHYVVIGRAEQKYHVIIAQIALISKHVI